MANPNINSPSACVVENAFVALTGTTATNIAANTANSNKVFLFDGILVSNVSANSAAITITITDASRSSPNNTAQIANAITVAPNSTLIVFGKGVVSLKEQQTLSATASAANALNITCFWKEFA